MFLVIGATGNIGSQLVKQLTSEKQPVRVLARDPGKVKFPGVDVVQGDVTDAAALEKAMSGVKAAFVLTSGESIPDERHVFAAAKKAGVGHVVKLSTAGAQKGSPI